MLFDSKSLLRAVSDQAKQEQGLSANNPTAAHRVIEVMQGLEVFASRGRTAFVNVQEASQMWLSRELMKEYIPASFHWQLPKDTAQVSGVLVVGMPFSIDQDGFKPAPKSEWDATLAQGNGQTSRLMAYYNKQTKSWVDYPIVRPDFAAFGFFTEDMQVWDDKIVKHPYDPANKKAEGEANWSVKLSRFSPSQMEGADEWAQLSDEMAANIREYAGYGVDSRFFGYMLMVGFVTDVHLHLPSNKKKEGSDEYEYSQDNGHMLSVTMPIFGVYVRPLTWRLDNLRRIDKIKSYIHTTSDANECISTPVNLNKIQHLIKVNKTSINAAPAQVRVTIEQEKRELPGFWYQLSTVSKLAICHYISKESWIEELASEVIKGAELSALMKERGLGNGALVKYVINKNLIPVLNKTGLGAEAKARLYFENLNKPQSEEVIKTPEVSVASTEKPKSILKDLKAKMKAKAAAEVVSVSETEPAPAAATPEVIKKVNLNNTEDDEEGAYNKVIKPSGAGIIKPHTPTASITCQELDEYAPQRVSAKVDFDALLNKKVESNASPTEGEAVNVVKCESFDLDSL